jgi:hypothetical protein
MKARKRNGRSPQADIPSGQEHGAMMVTSHVLVGASIGALTRSPVAAYGLGVVSHFVMDAVPHWGPAGDHQYFMTVAVRDGLCGLAALALSGVVSPRDSRRSVLAAAIGAATPDLDKPFEELTGRRLWPGPVRAFHSVIQRESPHRMRQELCTAAGAALLAGVLVRRSRVARALRTHAAWR